MRSLPLTISEQLEQDYKAYSRYVIGERAIPSIVDGLKPAQRRVLFVAKEYAKSLVKVAALAGRALEYHPHGDAPLCAAISLMAQGFTGANNFPYFDGKGAFGSRITGRGIEAVGAPRYVSVKCSRIFNTVLQHDYFITDRVPNYDKTHDELEYFFPLLPTILLNRISGIAVGFACEIHPHNPLDLIDNQIAVLTGKPQTPLLPWYKGFQGRIERVEGKFRCRGVFKRLDKKRIHITELPVSYDREYYVGKLDRLQEQGKVASFSDRSKESFSFVVTLEKPKEYQDDEKIYKDFGLEETLSQNLTVLDAAGNIKVFSDANEIIQEFTAWRVGIFERRYMKLFCTAETQHIQISRQLKLALSDILKEVPNLSDVEFRQRIQDILGVDDKTAGKFAEMQLRQFSKDRISEYKKKITDLETIMKRYDLLRNSREEQTSVYLKELSELRKWFLAQM